MNDPAAHERVSATRAAPFALPAAGLVAVSLDDVLTSRSGPVPPRPCP